MILCARRCCTPCTAHLQNRLVCRHDIDHDVKDEHNRTIIVVLAKHKIAPWWWFLREPKLVGAIVGILIVLIFLWFYNCVHQFVTIKKVLWYCWCTVQTWRFYVYRSFVISPRHQLKKLHGVQRWTTAVSDLIILFKTVAMPRFISAPFSAGLIDRGFVTIT